MIGIIRVMAAGGDVVVITPWLKPYESGCPDEAEVSTC